MVCSCVCVCLCGLISDYLKQTPLLFELGLLPRWELIELGLGKAQPFRVVLLVEVQFQLGRVDTLGKRTFQQHRQGMLLARQKRETAGNWLRGGFTAILRKTDWKEREEGQLVIGFGANIFILIRTSITEKRRTELL